MYTSAIKTGMKYLAASIVIAAAAAVYGLFGHGVYSYFMTYAFMIPLLCGALPHLAMALKAAGTREENTVNDGDEQTGKEQSAAAKIFNAKDMQLAFIATLTAGSLLKGALDIYGTTNRLLIAYPVIAVLIMAALMAMMIRSGDCSRIMKNK